MNCQFEEILESLLLRSLKGAHVNPENSDLITAKCTAVRFHLSFRCSSLICTWPKAKAIFTTKVGSRVRCTN